MRETKLLELLNLTWESTVFGDTYTLSTAVGESSILGRIDDMHNQLVRRLAPILTDWMHPISTSHVNEIIRQIAPKSVAFCSAIAAGELHDTERLVQAGLGIALAYWVDHAIDRGDLAMEEAVRWFARQQLAHPATLDPPSSAVVRTRLRGLVALDQSIKAFAKPEDAAILSSNMFQVVLCGEVRAREISREFGLLDQETFWQAHADELAEHALASVALVYVTAAMYAIHRCYTPDLPSLASLWKQASVMDLLSGPCSAMIRVLDDLGDRAIDSGTDLEWGHFTLNMFNQAHPIWIEAVARRAGLLDRPALDTLTDAFSSADRDSCDYIANVFVDRVRDEFAALPTPVYAAHRLFLDLGKRVIEAGYVNVLGDIDLAGA